MKKNAWQTTRKKKRSENVFCVCVRMMARAKKIVGGGLSSVRRRRNHGSVGRRRAAEHVDEIHREREDDGAVLLGGNGVQRLQIAELNRGGVLSQQAENVKKIN